MPMHNMNGPGHLAFFVDRFVEALTQTWGGGPLSWRWAESSQVPDVSGWWVAPLDKAGEWTVAIGAPDEVWGNLTAGGSAAGAVAPDSQSHFDILARSLERLVKAWQDRSPRFVAEVWGHQSADQPDDGQAAAIILEAAGAGPLPIRLVFSNTFSAELQSWEEPSPQADPTVPVAAALAPGGNAAHLLMDVEVPVSISLGRARLRIRDLLQLNQGSVVELDRGLEDYVEVLANNRLIALGQVVSVDGVYGVRIQHIAGASGAPQTGEGGSSWSR